MKYVRVYTRQRLAILLAGICIIIFLTSRQAFLDGYQYPTILPPSIAHSDPRPPASKDTPSQPTGSPSPPHDSPPDSHPKSHPDSPSPPHATSTTAHAETTPTPLVANSTSSHANPNTPRCGAYPKDADVVIVVKTGGTETFQKIPTQLMTFLQCAPDDVLIFSDMELDIGGRHIYDCLDKVIDKTKKHADFDLYRIQKEYQREGGDVSSLDRARDAWTLDKYKNIHTAQKAHQLRPDKSWYFFIDADTYIFWPSFFAWLKRLNPNDKLYLGSVVNVGVPPFAHGGSGYLLSKAAMAELVGDDAEELAARYDKAAIGGCCGDQEIAKILFDKGINATNVRPMINGEHAKSMPFGPSQWCQPLITMHHMTPESINDVWQYEGQRAHPNDILLSEDFFYTYAQEKIITSREEWDNVSNDNIYKKSEDNDNFGGWWTFNKPYFSYKSCSKACEEDERCFQFSYTSGECGFGAAFKVGAKRIPKDGVNMKSGWHLDKIAKFTGEHKCNGPDWDSLA